MKPFALLVPSLTCVVAAFAICQTPATSPAVAATMASADKNAGSKVYPFSTARPQIIAWAKTDVPYAIEAPHIVHDKGWVRGSGTWLARMTKLRNGQAGPMILQDYDKRLLNHPKDLARVPVNGKDQFMWTMSFENGIKETIDGVRQMCREIKAAGVSPTYWVADGEGGKSCWTLTRENLVYLKNLPQYKLLVANSGVPSDPSKADLNGLYKFNAEIARIQDAARKVAVYDVLEREFPGVPFSDYATNGGMTPADAAVAPDFNGHPQWNYRSKTNTYSPVIYGTLGKLGEINPDYKKPSVMVAYQLNHLIASWKNDRTRPVWPWLATRDYSNVLDATYFRELWMQSLTICGGHALYFNPKYIKADDAIITDACRGYERAAAGRSGGAPVANKFVTVTNTAFASTWVYPDGSSLSRVTMSPGADPTHLVINGQKVAVKIEDGGGCWRSLPAQK